MDVPAAGDGLFGDGSELTAASAMPLALLVLFGCGGAKVNELRA